MGIAGPSKETSKVSQGYEETETPINPRTLTKATTPLVTIKNFFKPKPVEKKPEVDGSPSETVEETRIGKSCRTEECKSDIIEEGIGSSPCDSNSSVTNKQELPADSNNKVKSIYFKSKGLKEEWLPESGTSAAGPGRSNDLTHHLPEPRSKENLQRKTSMKRTNSEAASRSYKRQKQSSILSSFGKGTNKPADKAKKEICCPICGVKFASEVKNAEINEHIDGCLTK